VRKYDDLVKDSEIRPLLSLDAPVGSDNPTPLVEQVDGGDDLLSRWQYGELREMAVDALRHLPERERTALSLYYIHEMSLKEVGSVLGVTESRACQLCSQGLKRLRFRLREHLN
jgi:RNA polymerase sigma factor for flagellar operon FliA